MTFQKTNDVLDGCVAESPRSAQLVSSCLSIELDVNGTQSIGQVNGWHLDMLVNYPHGISEEPNPGQQLTATPAADRSKSAEVGGVLAHLRERFASLEEIDWHAERYRELTKNASPWSRPSRFVLPDGRRADADAFGELNLCEAAHLPTKGQTVGVEVDVDDVQSPIARRRGPPFALDAAAPSAPASE
jgi:hypothetical protein